jgi:class 3 adenylate cyclase
MLPVLAHAFDVLLRHHLEIARRPITASQGTGVETQHRTIGFVDIVGSTALTERIDAIQLAAAITEFDGVTADTVTALGGRVVKFMGDGAMFVAGSPTNAVTIGLALADAFRGHAMLPSVRVALATGDVVARDGDFYGSVVNRAARALALAEPASVVVDRATADALPGGAFTLVDLGPSELKGFAEPTQLFTVTRRPTPADREVAGNLLARRTVDRDEQ